MQTQERQSAFYDLLNLTYNKWIVEKNHFMRQVQSAASTSPIIVG